MKKKALSLIIGLMSLSLLGLIGLQAYWVRHAITVKEEQFDRSVNDALNQVVHQLEVRELAAGLQKHLVTAPRVEQSQLKPIQAEQTAMPVKANPVVKTSLKKPAERPDQQIEYRTYPTFKINHQPEEAIILREDLNGKDIRIYRNATVPDKEKVRQFRQESQERFSVYHSDSVRNQIFFQHARFDSLPVVIRLNQDSIFKMLNTEQVTVMNNFAKSRFYDSLVFKRLLPVTHKIQFKTDTLGVRKNKPKKPENLRPVVVKREAIKRKEDQVNQVMEKMVMELVTKEVPLRKRLDFTEVDSLVAAALTDKNIDLPYAVAIANNQTDSLLHLKQVNTTFSETEPKYKVSLFPNDLVKKPDYLVLQFPDKQDYVLGSMWPMLSASAIFTLIMMLTFGATLGFIFKQKKISEIKSDFINNMTHEFKTPIATISLATDAINSPKVLADSQRINYYTGIIKQENKRMLSQVENVLQMALLDKQNLKLNFEKIELDAILNQAIEELKLQIESRQGQISFISGTAGINVYADQLHLENVFLNLLDNANKYSSESPEILVQSQVKNGNVYVTVTDHGIGMTTDTQKRVFDKFYRVPTGNLHNVKGFGLGLAYVKAMVEQHKGQVSVKSSPGKGSTFQVCLPIYKA